MNPYLLMILGSIVPKLPDAIEALWDEYKPESSDTKSNKDREYYDAIKEKEE